MKLVRRMYCRVFQQAFHLALPVLPYRRPVLLEGVKGVGALLKEKGIGTVLLVTDRGVRGLGLTRPLEEQLQRDGIRVEVYDGTLANPTTGNVEEARQLYLDRGCGALIGFGGGSAMDCAKAVGARIACPRKPLSRMRGILKVRRRIPLLIAVPTTAGTGSETTLAAVVVDSETRYKYPINDFALIPPYALLDPDVTLSLPPMLTACTGMDALTHAVEAYIGHSTIRSTREDARKAVSLIFRYLPRAVAQGDDREARAGMLEAAYCAGNAFTRSYVGYVHAVAHSLGGKYNLPHGQTNAILLPGVLEQYGSAVYRSLHELAIAAGIAGQEDSDEAAARRFIGAIREMNRQFGIPETISGIRQEDIPELARLADREANPLYPVPVEMDAEELEKLYRMVMEVEAHG